MAGTGVSPGAYPTQGHASKAIVTWEPCRAMDRNAQQALCSAQDPISWETSIYLTPLCGFTTVF
eukprot:1467502-Amphidinium_carterae.1